MSIDLNTVSLDDLVRLAGMSRHRAELLVDYRGEHGLFRTWDDVKSVPGFSQKFIEQLKGAGAFISR